MTAGFDVWRWVTIIALSAMLVFNTVFIILNHMFVPWRTNPWGRHVMMFAYSFAVTLFLVLLPVFIGRDYPYRREISSIAYVAMATTLFQRVWILVSQHLRAVRYARKQVNELVEPKE